MWDGDGKGACNVSRARRGAEGAKPRRPRHKDATHTYIHTSIPPSPCLQRALEAVELQRVQLRVAQEAIAVGVEEAKGPGQDALQLRW